MVEWLIFIGGIVLGIAISRLFSGIIGSRRPGVRDSKNAGAGAAEVEDLISGTVRANAEIANSIEGAIRTNAEAAEVLQKMHSILEHSNSNNDSNNSNTSSEEVK